MSAEVRRELLGLLSGLCDGLLTPTEHARLEALLDSDAACRRLYLEYLDTHARLLGNAGVLAPCEAPAATPRPRRRMAWLVGYAIAACLGALAVLFTQLWLPRETGTTDGPRPEGDPRRAVSVATLTHTADCEWETGPKTAGARLTPGDLRLKKGVARIRFDSGPDLVLEGPVELRVDSRTSATLLKGKVVFRADETAAAFELHTPASTLADLGAEYAVDVTPGGEEVHVFDGEVQRTPKAAAEGGKAEGAKAEHLTAGVARSYGPEPETPGKAAVYDPGRFVRQLTVAGQPPPDPGTGLLVYEGFEYASADALKTGKANGGYGWISRWTPGFARAIDNGDKALQPLNIKSGLGRRGAAMAPVGGCFEYAGFAKFHRRMALPLRLDADAVYYLSYLFRREGPPEDTLCAVAILFRTTEELERGQEDGRKRLNVGVGGPNQLFTHLGGVGSRTPVPLRFGETYLMVAKIVASKDGPDQVFMRVYGPDDAVEREEQGWTVTGPQFYSDLSFDWMEIHINSKTLLSLDEIRLGTSWQAVTAPWLAAAAGPKAGQ
jgi:hypothetical protein